MHRSEDHLESAEATEPRLDAVDAVDAARLAIWRLFEEGYVDEDMATAGLLAVDLGTRRAQRKHLELTHAESH